MNLFKTMLRIGRSMWPSNPLFRYLYSMRVKFDDGTEINVPDARSLVDYMRFRAYDKSKDNAEYMLNFAIRAVKFNDMDIRATSEEAFVDDLKKNGLISKI